MVAVETPQPIPMNDCNHKEADTWIVVHVIDSLEKEFNKILIHTVDTDIIVILMGYFHSIRENYQAADIWVAFSTGKSFSHYHINYLCRLLGREQSCCLPPFYAYTGCDSTSSFFGKTKNSAWVAWNSFSEVNEALLHIVQHPFDEVNLESPHFKILEHFTVVLYDKASILDSANEAHKEIYCKKIIIGESPTNSCKSVTLIASILLIFFPVI